MGTKVVQYPGHSFLFKPVSLRQFVRDHEAWVRVRKDAGKWAKGKQRQCHQTQKYCIRATAIEMLKTLAVVNSSSFFPHFFLFLSCFCLCFLDWFASCNALRVCHDLSWACGVGQKKRSVAMWWLQKKITGWLLEFPETKLWVQRTFFRFCHCCGLHVLCECVIMIGH